MAGTGLNMAQLAVDAHAAGPAGDRLALRWLSRAAGSRDFTYADLSRQTNRFANVLQRLGLEPGEAIAAVTGRVPELYLAALGALKARAVFCPLFANFGPEPLRTRLELGQVRLLVASERQYRRKIEPLRALLPALTWVLIVREPGAPAAGSLPEGTLDFAALMAEASDHFCVPPTAPQDRALLHFTSGTTGRPKAAVHVHEAILAHRDSAIEALGLQTGDVFWCTADPGWVTGTSYGFLAPLACGARLVIDYEEFDAERWCQLLAHERVNVWYTAPTAIRLLMRLPAETLARHDFSALKVMASVGEPLDPAAVGWARRVFGVPCRDTWWQTETGAIMIANGPRAGDSEVAKPGALGRPLRGIEAAIVAPGSGGGVVVLERPDQLGELALRAGWRSMFRGYLGEDERYASRFVDGWYLTGDLARRDAEGDFWFVGRADDVIKSAGHLIGPAEVEAVLRQHPAVADAAVIGLPDPVISEVVKAIVVLAPGVAGDEAVRRELLGHARRQLGAAVAPREIGFRDSLPKTRSGKILRRLLRAHELGLTEDDGMLTLTDTAA